MRRRDFMLAAAAAAASAATAQDAGRDPRSNPAGEPQAPGPLAAPGSPDPTNGGKAPLGAPIDPAWALARHWDDGLAEVAHYAGSQVVYKAPRPFEAVFITVKEPVNAELMIKADAPAPATPGGPAPATVVDALKLNMILDIPTPNYTYHHLVCVLNRRDNPAQLLRETAGCQEWCGNTYKELTNAGGTGRYVWRTYWEKEATGEAPARLDAERVTEEQLFMLVRALRFAPGASFTLEVYPSMIGNHAPKPDVRRFAFTMSEGPARRIGARSAPTRRIEGLGPNGARLSYLVGAEFPNPLVEFDADDGRSLRLKSIKRDDYWVIKK